MTAPSVALVDSLLAGDPRAIARAISMIEDDGQDGRDLVKAIFPHTGRAFIVGVTGAPGAGKSTLVDRLASEFRTGSTSGEVQEHHPVTVGILAVDPTSPFTGGAVLGDRLRMSGHASDPDVFIRSMATRGQLGGLARATGDATLLLDAAGKDLIIIETVGVGQDEVDIARTADASIVVLMPGTGDEVQALKAGIMEIADIFVVNKADREGADRLAAQVESAQSLRPADPGAWRPPVLKTVATSGQGIKELAATIVAFRRDAEQRTTGGMKGRRRMREERRLRDLVFRLLETRLQETVTMPTEWAALIDRIAAREIDPYTAASDLLKRAGITDS